MALIVEDGSIVANANTYVSLADARTRAAILGVTISATDATAELQLQQATLYVDRTYRDRFKGTKVDNDQPLQWPRYDVYIDDYPIDSDVIPQELIDSEIYAAAQVEAGNDLYANSDGRSVQLEEVVGAVKVQYFNNGKSGSQTIFTDIQNTIQVLLDGNGGKYSYSVRR
jgi:hypothetical protein